MIVIYHADVLCRVFCAQTHLIPCALGSACVSNDDARRRVKALALSFDAAVPLRRKQKRYAIVPADAVHENISSFLHVMFATSVIPIMSR